MKNVVTKFALGLSCLLILTAFAGTAEAAVLAIAPELDYSSTAAAGALLVGGYLLVVSKFRRK
jgi:hypothetical protein